MLQNMIAAVILAAAQQPIDQGAILRGGQELVPQYQPRQQTPPPPNQATRDRPDDSIATIVDTCLLILPSRPDRSQELQRMRRAWRGTRDEWEFFLRDCEVVAKTVALIRERLQPD